MPPKTPAQPASAWPLEPGQRVRLLWEVAKSRPCPMCGKVFIGETRIRQEKEGRIPVFAVVLERKYGLSLRPCCGQYEEVDGYVVESEDGFVNFALPEWLEAF